MSTTAPPPAAGGHKKRRQMIIAGVALAGLLFLYLRSRQHPAAAPPPAVDPNAAAAGQVPAGGGTGPSTFADNGAQAGSLSDAFTTGLSGMNQAIADQNAGIAAFEAANSTAGQSAPTSTPPTTINVYGAGPAGPVPPPAPPAPDSPPPASQSGGSKGAAPRPSATATQPRSTHPARPPIRPLTGAGLPQRARRHGHHR